MDELIHPTREELASLLAALHYGQYSTREDAKNLRKNIERALCNFDIGLAEFVPQETACPHGTPHRWPCEKCDAPVEAVLTAKCSVCVGTGEDFNEGDPCHACNGTGKAGVRAAPDATTQGWFAALADARLAARKSGNDWLVGKLDEIHQYLLPTPGVTAAPAPNDRQAFEREFPEAWAYWNDAGDYLRPYDLMWKAFKAGRNAGVTVVDDKTK